MEMFSVVHFSRSKRNWNQSTNKCFVSFVRNAIYLGSISNISLIFPRRRFSRPSMSWSYILLRTTAEAVPSRQLCAWSRRSCSSGASFTLYSASSWCRAPASSSLSPSSLNTHHQDIKYLVPVVEQPPHLVLQPLHLRQLQPAQFSDWLAVDI